MSSDASVASVGIGDGFGVKVFFRPLRDGEASRIDEEEDFVLGLLAWIRDHTGTVVAGVAFQAHMGGVARGPGEIDELLAAARKHYKGIGGHG